MAVMYPNNIYDLNPEDSELFVYQRLREQLDDSYTVYYSVEWNRKARDGSLWKSEADFIIENPKYGFLCLEVKGGNRIEISSEGRWSVFSEKYGKRELARSPYKQAEESMYFFKDKYKKEYHIDYPGLMGAGVVFPFYAFSEPEVLSRRDRVCTIEASDMDNLAEKIKDMFKIWGGIKFGRNRYSWKEHENFLDMIQKRTAIAVAAGALVKLKEKQLEEVNRVQNRYIHFLSNIRKFYIRGGAGTGKTWIALKMANFEALTGKKVLITCKSPTLCRMIQSKVRDDVSVLPFKELVKASIKGGYDAIFVDEAQDFSEDEASLIRSYLKDKMKSRLGVFYDDVQKVGEVSFGDAFKIELPHFLLHENIRNTANIYEYACKETGLGGDVITNPIEGPIPKCECVFGKKKLMQRLNSFLKEYLVDEKLQTSSIVILVEDLKFFRNIFPDGLAKWKFVIGETEKEDEIRISTVSDFKGLESDMILYIHEASISDNLNYIAFTRAKYYLIEFEVFL